MLNYIWGFMIIIGIVFGAFNGTMPEITNAALDSAKDAVSLCITMTGIMSLWVGLMEIAKNTGLIGAAARRIQPFISFMFPGIPKDHEAREYIATNIIANVLGLGWAATPAGLKAMQSMRKLNQGSRTASVDMCTFLIINVSSLQLIPVNIIAYRNQYGSVNPAAIIAPALIATTVTTVVGILFAKIMAVKNQ